MHLRGPGTSTVTSAGRIRASTEERLETEERDPCPRRAGNDSVMVHT